MKYKLQGLSILIVTFTLSGCGFFGGEHEVTIANPDFIAIDGPLRFEQSRSESRELRYMSVDADKYEVVNLSANNCSVSDQGNGYFSVSEVRSNCNIEFETVQKRFDVDLQVIGNGITEFVSKSYARSHDDVVNVIAVADYNTTRENFSASGCEVISDEEKPILELTNFTEDCVLSLSYEPKDDLSKTIFLSLVVSNEFLTYSSYNHIALHVENGWASLLIDRITVSGHLYGIQENGNRRLLENISTTFRNIPGSDNVSRRIGSEIMRDGGSKITKYEFEVLSVSNCSFGLWRTDSCLDIVGVWDGFAVGVEVEVLLPEG